jgi:hypothetical protein
MQCGPLFRTLLAVVYSVVADEDPLIPHMNI